MQYLQLYLSGDAFTVWSSISEADKKDEDKVVARLRESFQASAGEAYTQFVKRKKRGDETVDAYLADLRMLMTTSGHKEAADGKDLILMAQSLAGLPTKFANQLRMSIAANSGGLTLRRWRDKPGPSSQQ